MKDFFVIGALYKVIYKTWSQDLSGEYMLQEVDDTFIVIDIEIFDTIIFNVLMITQSGLIIKRIYSILSQPCLNYERIHNENESTV